jgi:hypothetical protein
MFSPLQHAQYQTLAMDVVADAVARCPIWSFCLDLVVLPKAIWSFWVSLRAKREKSGLKPQGLGKTPAESRCTGNR